MSSPARANRIARREQDEDLLRRRLYKAIDKLDRFQTGQQPHRIYVPYVGWKPAGGRGLIHKGRKP